MLNYKNILLYITFLMCGCASSDNEIILPEKPTTPPSDNVYFEFNKWVYNQMNHNYLWRKDLPDSALCDYDLAPKEFFNSLLSKKDRFSYFTNNNNYNPKMSTQRCGFAYQEYVDNAGNKALMVLYTVSSAAKNAGIKRGDFLSYVKDENNIFVFRRMCLTEKGFVAQNDFCRVSVGDGRTSSTVLMDTVYTYSDRRIGYLCYLQYEDIRDLNETLRSFREKEITDLILDLRYNPGGYVSTCKYLSNCIVDESAYGQIFQKQEYNDILSEENERRTGSPYSFTYYDVPDDGEPNLLGQPIYKLNQKRLYVLTSNQTASASEATIVCLRPFMDVILVGETTVGKGVGSWTISDSKYKYAIQPITMRYYNANDETVYDEGLKPDYYITDGYATSQKDIGDVNEPLLNTAINLILGTNHNNALKKSLSAAEQLIAPVGVPSFVTEFRDKSFD